MVSGVYSLEAEPVTALIEEMKSIVAACDKKDTVVNKMMTAWDVWLEGI